MNKKDSDSLERIIKAIDRELDVTGDIQIRYVKDPSLFNGPWVVANYHSPAMTAIYGSGNTPQEAFIDALHNQAGTEVPPF